MKRDCMCGHMWAAHRQWAECAVPACGCLLYRPRPRRWFPHKPPAGSRADSPDRAQIAQRSSLPGPAPSPPVELEPPAGTGTTARTLATTDHLDCGCAITYYRTSHIKGTYPSTCRQHECALCRWVPDRAHAVYTWQPCPAHEPVVTP